MATPLPWRFLSLRYNEKPEIFNSKSLIVLSRWVSFIDKISNWYLFTKKLMSTSFFGRLHTFVCNNLRPCNFHCLLIRSVRRRSKKTSKLRLTSLFAGNSPMIGDADVDSVRIRVLIQSYTWNVLSRRIHGGIRNIQHKTRLRAPFHRHTIAFCFHCKYE